MRTACEVHVWPDMGHPNPRTKQAEQKQEGKDSCSATPLACCPQERTVLLAPQLPSRQELSGSVPPYCLDADIGGRCHTSCIPFHTQDGRCDFQLPTWQLFSVDAGRVCQVKPSVWILGQTFFCIANYFPKLFQVQWESNIKESHPFTWDALFQLYDLTCLLPRTTDI